MGWELYEEPPEGFSIDKHTGSPLSGYDFFTNGKSVLNGQKRVLVKANIPANDIAVNHPTSKMQKPKSKEPKQDPMINRDVRQRVNDLCPLRDLKMKLATRNRI